jgi:hypothetical protein
VPLKNLFYEVRALMLRMNIWLIYSSPDLVDIDLIITCVFYENIDHIIFIAALGQLSHSILILVHTQGYGRLTARLMLKLIYYNFPGRFYFVSSLLDNI